MLEGLIFVIVFIVFLIYGQLFSGLIYRKKVIDKPFYIIGMIGLAILTTILFVNIGNSSTKKYVYTKKYLVTKNFYYKEEKISDIFNFLKNGEQGKKMAFLADGKRYEVYASDIENRYDFANSKSKKGTTQLIVEIPKIRDNAPNLNKKFFNMSEMSNIKVTKTIYK